MIKDNCLEGVEEVYGHHNWPTHKVGFCMVMDGPVMSEFVKIDIKLIGKGGHSSNPQTAIDPV
jgi:hippurate hydrolase